MDCSICLMRVTTCKKLYARVGTRDSGFVQDASTCSHTHYTYAIARLSNMIGWVAHERVKELDPSLDDRHYV